MLRQTIQVLVEHFLYTRCDSMLLCREPLVGRAACAAQNGVPACESPNSGTQKTGGAIDYADVSAYEISDGHVRGGTPENDDENADNWCEQEPPVVRSLLGASHSLRWGCAIWSSMS